MGAPSEIRYVRVDDGIDVAYTVFGEGPDLFVAPAFTSHLDLIWDLPPYQGILALGRKFRVIVADRRGTGLSDRSLGIGTLEDRAGDISAVLDAAGSEHAIIYAMSECGPLAAYYTATHPERVRALILYGTYRCTRPEVVCASSAAAQTWLGRCSLQGPEAAIGELVEDWGRGVMFTRILSHPPDPAAAQELLARYERAACTPQMVRQILLSNWDLDVTPYLDRIAVPTLVMQGDRDPIVPVECGRDLAAHIPGARYAEIAADFHGSWRREDLAGFGAALDAFCREALGEPAPPFRKAFDGGRDLAIDDAVVRARRTRRGERPASGWDSLTPAELQVSLLVAEGLSNRAIARRLHVSVNTVKTHLAHAFGKLRFTSRSELAAEAVRRLDD